jgi:membrane protease YdiL (CAAX protease family)
MLIRVAPFIVFVLLTACQGRFGEASRYWVYLLKTLAGAGVVLAVRPWLPEMRWKWSWEAGLAGVAVFLLWVGLDGLYPSSEKLFKLLLCPLAKPLGFEEWCAAPAAATTPWNPHTQFGPGLALAFALARLVGSSLVVPPLEEVFYRSFLYRYICRPEFETVPFDCFRWGAFLLTAAIFGFAHYEWLPGMLCAMIYQGLVLRKNRLGDAMTAHAITNALLGLWVIWKGAWHFW